MYLEAERATFVERIVQLDLKVSRTFRFGRMSVLPTFEVFNVNNSDAIVSYVTTNALAAGYLRPNSILQGRMTGWVLPHAGNVNPKTSRVGDVESM